MERKYLNILLLIVFLHVIKNGFSQGLIFDSTMFNKQQEFPIERSEIPSSVSLENYLPALYPQTGSTCVAMSLALARTIMLAKSTGVTDRAHITRNQMSPYFIYYYSREEKDYSCQKGLDPLKALSFVKNVGFRKMAHIELPSYFPFKNNFLCPSKTDFLPPNKQEHQVNAAKFRISDYYVIKNIEGIKAALAYNLPVILGIHTPKSFENAKSALWTPAFAEKGSKGENHTVVAIGYDDKKYGGSIRIANSWGTEWGDDGKIWIKYSDLMYWLKGAYIMIAEATSFSSKTPLTLEIKKEWSNRYFMKNEYSGKVNFDNKEYIKYFSSGTID
jgi:hypothetical protein